MNLLKVGEAAELMGVPAGTLRVWHNTGKFEADVVYPGSKHRFYDKERVLEYKKQFTAHRKGAHTKERNKTQELEL